MLMGSSMRCRNGRSDPSAPLPRGSAASIAAISSRRAPVRTRAHRQADAVGFRSCAGRRRCPMTSHWRSAETSWARPQRARAHPVRRPAIPGQSGLQSGRKMPQRPRQGCWMSDRGGSMLPARASGQRTFGRPDTLRRSPAARRTLRRLANRKLRVLRHQPPAGERESHCGLHRTPSVVDRLPEPPPGGSDRRTGAHRRHVSRPLLGHARA